MSRTDDIISQIKECKTRDEAAKVYTQILKDMHGVSFHEINDAIKIKWSLAGLKYIKREAWNLVGPVGNYVR